MISIEPKSQGTDTVLSGSKVPQGLWQDDTVYLLASIRPSRAGEEQSGL